MFPYGDSAARDTQDGNTLKKKVKRRRGACENCRLRKVRCSGGQPCAACHSRDEDCRYTSSAAPSSQSWDGNEQTQVPFTLEGASMHLSTPIGGSLPDNFSLDSVHFNQPQSTAAGTFSLPSDWQPAWTQNTFQGLSDTTINSDLGTLNVTEETWEDQISLLSDSSPSRVAWSTPRRMNFTERLSALEVHDQAPQANGELGIVSSGLPIPFETAQIAKPPTQNDELPKAAVDISFSVSALFGIPKKICQSLEPSSGAKIEALFEKAVSHASGTSGISAVKLGDTADLGNIENLSEEFIDGM
ncbi:hypothetical protein PFICI_00028 [Pestalotiopsis fici W106-1]|uniref:Zn(2)-C6 fungal-type domain-containing protein n=1 Tax=Pestalotiopsis fici (strain W106-1 / CGMCC3.15140) TaxID=1229662 RepID=W3XJK4_PESFW|nr:uncharacterized protein PFICI_00028 [Pestalotiopsis fici W106-1]ETS86200.1 hypothetical protein PFICI_00028 [Pestalotiopsis fici W106-1]